MELSSMWKQDWGPCFLAGCWLSLSQLLEAIHTSRHVTPFPHLQSQKPWIESFTCFESLWLLLLPHLSCFQPEKVFCFKEVMWLDWANPDNTWQSLYFMKVKVQSLSPVGLFATPWTVSYQVPPPIGFSRQEYEWVAIPFSRGSSQSRDWTQVSCIAGSFFTIWTTRESLNK